MKIKIYIDVNSNDIVITDEHGSGEEGYFDPEQHNRDRRAYVSVIRELPCAISAAAIMQLDRDPNLWKEYRDG